MKTYIKMINANEIEVKTRKNAKDSYIVSFTETSAEKAEAYNKLEKHLQEICSCGDERHISKKLIHLKDNTYFTVTYNTKYVSHEIHEVDYVIDEEYDNELYFDKDILAVVEAAIEAHTIRLFAA